MIDFVVQDIGKITISNFIFGKMNYHNPHFFDIPVSIGIFLLILMPIGTIAFNSKIHGRNVKINRISTTLEFLIVLYAQRIKSKARSFFNQCFGIGFSIASKGTELSIFVRWYLSEFNTTCFASNILRWPPTLLRAMFWDPSLLSTCKRLSASIARVFRNVCGSTLPATYSISIRCALRNGKFFFTNWTRLYNSMKFTLTFSRTKASSSMRGVFVLLGLRWRQIKLALAVLAGEIFSASFSLLLRKLYCIVCHWHDIIISWLITVCQPARGLARSGIDA